MASSRSTGRNATPKHGPKVFDAYIRISKTGGRDKDPDRFISPRDQRRRITGWAMARGEGNVTIGEWFEDRDVSGATTASERPQLAKAFKRIEAGASQGIVVAKLDRFSRSVAGALRDLEWLRGQNAEFASVDDNIDTTTPNGEFLFTVTLAMAQLERAQRAEGWERARRDAVLERGWHLTSEGVTGYVLGSQPLKPHPRWGPAVTKMFRELATGGAPGSIAQEFNYLGVPRGRRQVTSGWEAQHITKMAARRVYLGEAHHGQDIVKPGAHPALTDEVTWQAAQRDGRGVMHAHSRGMRLQKAALICAQCCQPLRGGTVNDHGSRVAVYRCRGTRSGERCPGPQVSITASVIDPWVDEQARSRLDQLAQNASGYWEQFATVTAALEEAVRDRDATLKLRGIVDEDAYIIEARARQDLIDELRGEIGALHAANPKAREVNDSITHPLLAEAARRTDIFQVIDCVIVRPAPRQRHSNVAERCIVVPRGKRPDYVANHYRPTARQPFPWEEWIATHGDGHAPAA
jgi:DNA invertase Pin-like site-specific DNA recombinase